jgi:hypothetical protein
VAASSRALAALLNKERKLLLLELRLGTLRLEPAAQATHRAGTAAGTGNDDFGIISGGRSDDSSSNAAKSHGEAAGVAEVTNATALAQQLGPRFVRRCLAALRSQAAGQAASSSGALLPSASTAYHAGLVQLLSALQAP